MASGPASGPIFHATLSVAMPFKAPELRTHESIVAQFAAIVAAFCLVSTMPWIHMCDECVNAKSTVIRTSAYYGREVRLCNDCNDYMWRQATKEASKFSEFKNASDAATIFDKDGSCMVFDRLIDSLAKRCEIRENLDEEGDFNMK